MDWKVFATVFGTMFLAELGDKTQLLVLSLALRGKFWVVVGGAVAAMASLTLVATALGSAIVAIFPLQYVELGAAILFILLGLWMLYKAFKSDDDEDGKAERVNFTSVFVLMFIAELGDKTQLATLGLTARFPDFPLMVWLGAFGGLSVVTVIGVLLGRTIADRIPRQAISIIAAFIFIAFGIISLIFP